MLKYHLVPFSASKLQSLHSSILAHPLCMCMYGVADLPNDRMEAAVVVQLITGPPFVYVYGVADLPSGCVEATVVAQFIIGPPFVYVCMV